jgi:hypothetical protein
VFEGFKSTFNTQKICLKKKIKSTLNVQKAEIGQKRILGKNLKIKLLFKNFF